MHAGGGRVQTRTVHALAARSLGGPGQSPHSRNSAARHNVRRPIFLVRDPPCRQAAIPTLLGKLHRSALLPAVLPARATVFVSQRGDRAADFLLA